MSDLRAFRNASGQPELPPTDVSPTFWEHLLDLLRQTPVYNQLLPGSPLNRSINGDISGLLASSALPGEAGMGASALDALSHPPPQDWMAAAGHSMHDLASSPLSMLGAVLPIREARAMHEGTQLPNPVEKVYVGKRAARQLGFPRAKPREFNFPTLDRVQEAIDMARAASPHAGNWYGLGNAAEVLPEQVRELLAPFYASTSPRRAPNVNLDLTRTALERTAHGLDPYDPNSGMLPVHGTNLRRAAAGEPISGRKISPYAEAMQGNPNAPVGDTWMARFHGLTDKPTDFEHAVMLNRIRQNAAQLGTRGPQYQVGPSELQDLEWHDIKHRLDTLKGSEPLKAQLAKLDVAPPRAAGNPAVLKVVDDYLREAKIATPRLGRYAPQSPELGRRFAQMYEQLPTEPQTPETAAATKASYDAFKRETDAQLSAIKRAGYKIQFVNSDPYTSSEEMMKDVRDHKRLKVLRSPEAPHSQLSADDNNKFRAVHDFFGHSREGYQFGPRGEDNAWRAHAAMYSNAAIPAMTTETRGQNSWVNFTPGHEELPITQRPFAVQKAGLLPEEVYAEVLRKKPTAYDTPVKPKAAAGRTPAKPSTAKTGKR